MLSPIAPLVLSPQHFVVVSAPDGPMPQTREHVLLVYGQVNDETVVGTRRCVVVLSPSP